MRTVLSISLPKQISQDLNRFAKNSGRNKSDIVKESISLYLWESRFKQTKKRLSAKAKKAGVVTENDIFKAIS
jgi:metal-responsive CopG/Arc/MetJ family transcriptional regulator